MDIFWVKIIGAIVSFVMTLGAGFLPRINALRLNPFLLELLNMFGGGVFLSVAIMDLLPDMQEGFEGWNERHGFRLGDILVLLGYAALLFLEKVLFKHDHAFHHHHHPHPREEGKDDSEEGAHVQGSSKKDPPPPPPPHSHSNPPRSHAHGHGHSHEDGHGHGHASDVLKTTSSRGYGSADPSPTPPASSPSDAATVVLDGGEAKPLLTPQEPVLEQERKKSNRRSALITVLLLLAALAVHGFFEGLVMGSLASGTDSISLVLAIVSHKPLESLSLGTIMIRGHISFKFYLPIIIAVSLFTPAGVAVGLALETVEETGLTVPIFYALAVGSFIYISTTEIVAEEISHIKRRRDGYFKFIAFLVGNIFIGLINTLVPLA